jgi:hypothetical protein
MFIPTDAQMARYQSLLTDPYLSKQVCLLLTLATKFAFNVFLLCMYYIYIYIYIYIWQVLEILEPFVFLTQL